MIIENFLYFLVILLVIAVYLCNKLRVSKINKSLKKEEFDAGLTEPHIITSDYRPFQVSWLRILFWPVMRRMCWGLSMENLS